MSLNKPGQFFFHQSDAAVLSRQSPHIDSDWKRIRQKCCQFFINEKFKKYFICLPAFYLIMCLMKSLKNFEKLAIFEIWQLVSFWGVKIHFGEKYDWFAIETLFMEANLSIGYVMVPKNHQKIIYRYNTDYINY